MTWVIEVERATDEYGDEEWRASVKPPLNDGGPYIRWPTAAALLSAIADDFAEIEVPA